MAFLPSKLLRCSKSAVIVPASASDRSSQQPRFEGQKSNCNCSSTASTKTQWANTEPPKKARQQSINRKMRRLPSITLSFSNTRPTSKIPQRVCSNNCTKFDRQTFQKLKDAYQDRILRRAYGNRESRPNFSVKPRQRIYRRQPPKI